jgi:hypothetical protein
MKTLSSTMILKLKVKLQITLKEQIIISMILFMCQIFLSCMLQMVTLLNLLLILATIMKKEVISALNLYDTNNYKLHAFTGNKHFYNPIFCDLFICNMTMHRKEFKLLVICFMLCTCCALSCFSFTITFIDASTPWDLDIL